MSRDLSPVTPADIIEMGLGWGAKPQPCHIMSLSVLLAGNSIADRCGDWATFSNSQWDLLVGVVDCGIATISIAIQWRRRLGLSSLEFDRRRVIEHPVVMALPIHRQGNARHQGQQAS